MATDDKSHAQRIQDTLLNENTTKNNAVYLEYFANSGRVLIFNHLEFDPRTNQKPRPGSEKDAEDLRQVLESLNFEVNIHDNLTLEEIKEKIKLACTLEDWSEMGCVIVVVLSHGERNGKLWAFDQHYHTSDIWNPILQVPSLQGKPKIFIFQACRGKHKEVRSSENSTVPDSEINTRYINALKTDCDCKNVQRLPNSNDVIIAYSTTELCESMRDNKEGTWYIQTLCKELQTWGTSQCDLVESLTRVTNQMVENNMGGDTINLSYGQTPIFTSYMTKEVFYRRDGPVLQPILYSWTDYCWRGRALVFCDTAHSQDALNLQKALESLDFTVVVKQIDCHESYIDYIANMGDNFTYEGCIVIAVLAKYDEKIHFNKHLPFIVSTLTYTYSRLTLANKPKILLFFDANKDVPSQMLQMDDVLSPKHTTEHSDFCIIRGFGQEFLDKFICAVTRDRSIIDTVTSTIKSVTPNATQQYSHFESTLRATLKFNTKLESLPYEHVEQKRSLNDGIHFNIIDDISDFYVERTEEMDIIKETMLDKKQGYPIDIAITGLSGVGKTQLVLNYIKQDKENGSVYKNIIWLNATDLNSLIFSFTLLAKRCNILCHIIERSQTNIISKVYDYFQNKGNTLFIFDDASSEILDHLPPNTTEYPDIYIICTTKRKLNIKVKKSLDLDVFTPLKSAEFLCRRFKDLNYNTEDISLLSCSLGHMPLALNIAAATILLQNKNTEDPQANHIKDYISNIKIDGAESDHLNIIIATLVPTLEILETLKNSETSRKILHILSFLDSTSIPTDLTLYLIENVKILNQIFKDLKMLCLITCKAKFTNVHNLVQMAIQKHYKSQEPDTIKSGFEIFESIKGKFIHNLNEELNFPLMYSPHAVKFLQNSIKYPEIVNEHAFLPTCLISDLNNVFNSNLSKNLGQQVLSIMEKNKSLSLRNALADTSLRLGNYQEALNDINALLNEEGTWNIDQLSTLSAIYHNKAFALYKLGQLEESLIWHNETIKCNSKLFGENHRNVLASKNNKARVLCDLNKFEEALEIYFNVYDQMKLIGFKEDNTKVSQVCCNIANILASLGHHLTAYEMLDVAIGNMEKKFGKLNGRVLSEKHNKALLLESIGKSNADILAEFKTLFYDKCEALGKNHPSTQQTGEKIAAIYNKVGSFEEAQNLYNDVIISLENTLGKLHPTVLTIKSNSTLVLQNNGQYFAAYIAYLDIYKDTCDALGPDHTSSLDVREKLAYCSFMMDNAEEALTHYNEIVNKIRKKFGPKNPDLQMIRHNRAMVLNKLHRNNEAFIEFIDIISIDEEHYGRDHIQTLRTKERVANVLRDCKKYNEALILFNDILPKLKAKLGSLHQDVTAARVNRAQVLHHMGKYASALKIYFRCMKIFGTDHHLSEITTQLYYKAHDDLMHNGIASSDEDDGDISDEFEYSDDN